MSAGNGEREFRFPPDAAQVRWLRDVARDAAADMGMHGVCDSLALVLDELANNAIEHGGEYRSTRADLRVRLFAEESGVRVEFEDREMPVSTVAELAAVFRRGAEVSLPDLDSERGRGLYLIAIHFATVEVETGPRGGFLFRGLLVDADRPS